jgi:DNA-binding MarR family transcriptional regulator
VPPRRLSVDDEISSVSPPSPLGVLVTNPPSLSFDPIEEATRQWRAHGWDDAADGMAAVTSLMRAQAIMLARAEDILRPLALTFARYELLTLLSFTRRGSLPMAKVGSLLQVHATSVTNAVTRLENAGLVRRDPHPDDARAVLVSITKKGRTLQARATTALNDGLFTQPGLSPNRLKTLVSILREFRHDTGDFE